MGNWRIGHYDGLQDNRGEADNNLLENSALPSSEEPIAHHGSDDWPAWTTRCPRRMRALWFPDTPRRPNAASVLRY